MNFGNSVFSLAGQPPQTGVLTPGVALEAKALSGWQRAWASGADFSPGGASDITTPLEQSPWILAAVRALAAPMTAVPLHWYDKAEEKTREHLPEDGERSDFWMAPCANEFGPVSLDDVIFSLTALLALEGVAYIVLDDDWLSGRRSRLSAPIVTGHGEMNPIFSGRGASGLVRDLAGYVFSGSGVSAQLIPDQVIRIAWENPYNRERGLGAWAAAKTAADSDRAAEVFSRNVAKSNGANGDYIVTDGGMVNAEQQAQIVAALQEKRRRAERGDYAPTFLAGGLKVQSPAERSVSAALLAGRTANREAICAAFGIPLSMLQPVTGSSLGEGRVDSEQRQLITNGTMPLARRIATGFSRVEQMRSRRAAFACFDIDDHPAMRSARLALADTAEKFVRMGFALAEVNQNLGLGFDMMPAPEVKAPGSAEMLPADGVANELANAAKQLRALCQKSLGADCGGGDAPRGWNSAQESAPSPISAPVEPARLVIEVKADGMTSPANAAPDPIEPAPTPGVSGPAAISMGARKPRDAARLKRWEKYQQTRKPFEARIKKAVQGVFNAIASEALATLEKEIPQNSQVDAAMAVKALMDIEGKALSFAVVSATNFAQMLTSAVLPIITEAYAAGTEEAASEMQALGIAPGTPREVAAFTKVRENMLADSSQATFDALQASLSEGYDAGETMGQLAGRVKQVLRTENDSRAVTIAVTETHTAFNVARTAQFEAAGVEYKEWLSAGDSRVRADHAEMDAVVMPMSQPFTLPDGTELMHPCAEGGPAGQVINCRCISVAVGGAEGERRFAEQTPQ